MMNETILKFNYPDSLIREYNHWVILLRPKQITVGSLVLASKSNAENLSQLSPESFIELTVITKHIEEILYGKLNCQKINYLLLMMLDKHVHFHVLPRYSTETNLFGIHFADINWPKAPKISDVLDLSIDQLDDVLLEMRFFWATIE
jgi:diadenosine tetraphosphate (Ap4A) HIT family hydrolase